MSNFTPGPWSYDPEARLVTAARDGKTESPTICDLLDTTEGLEGDCPDADANGKLIAAAPALLAACEATLAYIDSSLDDGFDKVDLGILKKKLHDAIARARGEV